MEIGGYTVLQNENIGFFNKESNCGYKNIIYQRVKQLFIFVPCIRPAKNDSSNEAYLSFWDPSITFFQGKNENLYTKNIFFIQQ
jgi:hypothetical protein